MSPLTDRQQRVLDFIVDFMHTEGFPPTRAEICDALGFRSPNAAEDHLRALVKKGAIEMLPGTSRGIRPLGKSTPSGLPLVGRVAAGEPILAAEHIEQRYKVDPSLFRPRADYLLRVKGMSMCDIGILDGDLLAVHQAREAASGEVVVARLDDEVTVKRFRRRGNIVRLLPENPDFDPIVVDLREQELVIEGIAVGVIRNGGAL
jgi:repressor LexA